MSNNKHIVTKNGQRIYPKTLADIVEDVPRNQSVEESLTELFARNDVYIAVIDATQDPISCSIQEYANISNAINNNTTVVAKVIYGTNLFIFIPLSFFRDDTDGHSAVFSILLSGTNAIFTIYQNDSEVDFEIVNSTPIWGNIEGNIEDQTDLNNILTGLDNDITAVENDVDDIQDLIPAQATVNNQLADKDFVNSSIATSTATFRETYNIVTDLHLSTSATHQQVATALGNTISVADNNDYCFVEIPTDDLTPTETLQVDRYKYNGSSWSFEYTLNNSGYTSAQWNAINSGISSGKVATYDDYASSKQDTLTPGDGIDITGNVISCNLQLEHKSYYDTSTYTLYEGIAPNGSTTSQAVWTITTIVSNAIGTIVSTSTATNQTWNYN